VKRLYFRGAAAFADRGGHWIPMMRQATTAQVRFDASKAARFNVSAQSNGGFGRLLPHTERRLPLPETPKSTILASQRPRIRGNVG
jgi:hypothetical protein